MADWIEKLGIGLSHEELQKKAAVRVAELQSKWRRRSAEDFRDDYDLVKRVNLAWQIRQDIRKRLTQKEQTEGQEQTWVPPVGSGAYSMFLSRSIDFQEADLMLATVREACEGLDIRVIGSGGGLEPPYTASIFNDVAMKIRSCETLLAIVTPRPEGESNIWIVSEVAMALALEMPVALLIDEIAHDEQWKRLGHRYREFKFNAGNRDDKIWEAIKEIDVWLLNEMLRQQL